MRKKKPCFLVLESYWSENLRERESVQPFVKGLCDLHAWEFHYRTFDSANDLKLWIKNFNSIRRSRLDKIVYLATHGSKAGKLRTLEQNIPLESLARIVRPAKSIVGLHLGSCNLGQLFWSWIYAGAPRPKRARRLTPELAAHELYARFNYAREMGFRVVSRRPGAGGITSSWDTWEEPATG
jgi:hypothetical protein